MMEELVKILRQGNHSLVLQGSSIRSFDGRGVSDLYRLLQTNAHLLQSAQVADKIVGKGAAALMVLGKVSSVYAEVISRPALDLLRRADIDTQYGQLVENIINRTGKGVCPLESRLMPYDKAEACFPEIQKFLIEMNSK